MYIYNVTINIAESAHDQWLTWMKETHIPDMMATGKFLKAKMCKVLVEEEMGGITYSVQYTVKDRETLDLYYKEDADGMRQDGLKLFADQFVAFRTELEIINEQETTILSATENLFTYGTLQDEAVQTALFTRKLKGAKDILLAHEISEEKVVGLYPTIVYTGIEKHKVYGEVFTVSGTDLLKADAYEGEAYHRKKVTLASGINAWVYLGSTFGK
jgi:gamma-glutamylcyclotransferase (GGCT)/AIG2-like uncharacterized protein YtfP